VLLVLFVCSSTHARKAIIDPQKVSTITSPEDSRDIRILLYFELPDEIFDSKAIVDFALLNCRAQIKDTIAGQINVFPVTTDWKNQSQISWNEPWEKSGGDYSEEYMMSNYTLKSEWGIKEFAINVTEIVQDWQKGRMDNSGVIIKLSKDDLDNCMSKYVFDQGDVTLKILYSYEYK